MFGPDLFILMRFLSLAAAMSWGVKLLIELGVVAHRELASCIASVCF